jgi:hypothetical protein
MDQPAERLNLGAAFSFPFSRQAWGDKAFVNLLLIAVCFLIPIVGPMVAIGYGVLVEKAMIQDPLGPAPPFDFSKFTDHLRRGIAPFVAGLLLLPLWIIVVAIVFLPLILILANSHAEGIEIVAILVAGYLFTLLLMLIAGILVWPIALRAMLEQKILAAFGLGFIFDFHRRVWLEEAKLAGAWILLMIPLILFSCIPFLSYFLVAGLLLVSWHAHAQLYRLYVARGGTPLSFTPITVDLAPAFPVQPSTPPFTAQG